MDTLSILIQTQGIRHRSDKLKFTLMWSCKSYQTKFIDFFFGNQLNFKFYNLGNFRKGIRVLSCLQ